MLDDLRAIRITESTYRIESDEQLKMLSSKIARRISKDDNVFIISYNDEGMFHSIINQNKIEEI